MLNLNKLKAFIKHGYKKNYLHTNVDKKVTNGHWAVDLKDAAGMIPDKLNVGTPKNPMIIDFTGGHRYCGYTALESESGVKIAEVFPEESETKPAYLSTDDEYVKKLTNRNDTAYLITCEHKEFAVNADYLDRLLDVFGLDVFSPGLQFAYDNTKLVIIHTSFVAVIMPMRLWDDFEREVS